MIRKPGLIAGIFILIVVIAAVARISIVSSSWKSAPKQLPVYGNIPDFNFKDQNGQSFGKKNIEGPWVAGFFFTRCAGTCPMMMEQMKDLSRRLPDSVRLISFSADPRDDEKSLAQYGKTQGISWTMLAGEAAAVEKLSKDGFHLALGQGDSKEEPVLHSQKFVLVDASGQIRGYYDGTDSSAMRTLAKDASHL